MSVKMLSYPIALLLLRWSLTVDAAHFDMFGTRQSERDPCYDDDGRAVRCLPNFINAAFGKPVISTSTCGLMGPSRYCMVAEDFAGRLTEKCDVCDDGNKEHPASLITDHNNPQNSTCW